MGTSSYNVVEDYSAGPEILESLIERRNQYGSEATTLPITNIH